MAERWILHVDMDAFYASVEQRDRPELRGKPVVVGGDPRSRGVVSTASYEARAFGIHSAMPLAQARRLCPHAVFLPVDMGRYRRVSNQLEAILLRFTPLVERLALDEAYLDVTGSQRLFGSPADIARAIKQAIRQELSLTASVGVAPNKLLAKVASDLHKPDGLVVVEPGQAEAFLAPLPVGRLWGIGKVTAQRLAAVGVQTVGDLQSWPLSRLQREFGVRQGEELWRAARGLDSRPVETTDTVKSIGREETFASDIRDCRELYAVWRAQSDDVARRLRRAGCLASVVTIKLRDSAFHTITRQCTLPHPTDVGREICRTAQALFEQSGWQGRPLRLIGVSAEGLRPADAGRGDDSRAGEPRQLSLFAAAGSAAGGDSAAAPRWRKVEEAVARLQERMGPGVVVPASEWGQEASRKRREFRERIYRF